jgi:hypothetical protein
MCEGRIDAGSVQFYPDNYLPNTRTYTFWPNWIYMLFRAGLEQRRRRAIISVSLTVVEYLVGLGIAAFGGFLNLYVATPAVYVLCLAFGFYMGRARWLTLRVPEILRCLRPVFDEQDAEFRKTAEQICSAARNRVFIIPLTLIVIAATWSAVGVYYFGPTESIRHQVSNLVAPTFPPMWQAAPDKFGKMLIIDMFLGLTCAFGVPLIFGSMVGLIGTYFAVLKWKVAPLPAYVTSALRPTADFLFSAGTYYALGVAVLAVVYAGKVNAVILSVTIVLSIGGLGCLFGPYLGFRRIIDRARDGLGEDVVTAYYRDVRNAPPLSPLGEPTPGNALAAPDHERYAGLLQLEQLMHAASQDTGLVYRIDYVLRGSLIQLSPAILAILVQFLPLAQWLGMAK